MTLNPQRTRVKAALGISLALLLGCLSGSDSHAATRSHRHTGTIAHHPKRFRYTRSPQPPAPSYQPTNGDGYGEPVRQQRPPAANAECSSEFPAPYRYGLYRDNIGAQHPCF